MNKVLIIGSSGLVGSKYAYNVPTDLRITPDEKTLDITNGQSVEDYFEREKDNFEVVINFAAFTNVDAAEKERGDKNGLCYKLNVVGAENVAKACLKYHKFLIHMSTDFIFPGTEDNPGPYEEDTKLPDNLDEKMGWYGWTKNRGEVVVNEVLHDNRAIVRIAYPFCSDNYDLKLDFVKNYLKLYQEGKLFPIFTDQIFTPLLLDQLVPVLNKIVEGNISGIFHVVSADSATPFDFVSYLLEKAEGVKDVVQKGSMVEFLKVPGRTPRSKLGGLKSEKTQKILDMKFMTWKEMIDKFLIDSISV